MAQLWQTFLFKRKTAKNIGASNPIFLRVSLCYLYIFKGIHKKTLEYITYEVFFVIFT